MTNIRHILCPTDLSPLALAAKPFAFELAQRFDAEVTLLHVRVPFSDDPLKITRELDDPMDSELEKIRISGSDLTIHTKLERNVSPAAGILEYLAENPVDLVVMATHGRGGMSHFLLGSVTERVVRAADVPVLTVGREVGKPRFENILAAFDFSPHSLSGARLAAAFARRLGAQLHVLYVIEQQVHPAFYDLWREQIRKSLPDVAAAARQALEKAIGEEEEIEDYLLDVTIGEGPAYRDIIEFAKENKVDLIVLGNQGLSDLDHLLIGSTAERVLRKAPCPVLIVKAPSDNGS